MKKQSCSTHDQPIFSTVNIAPEADPGRALLRKWLGHCWENDLINVLILHEFFTLYRCAISHGLLNNRKNDFSKFLGSVF